MTTTEARHVLDVTELEKNGINPRRTKLMNKRVTVLLGEPDKYCSLVADRFWFVKGELYVARSETNPNEVDDLVGWFSEGTYKAVYCTESNGKERQ